MGPGSRSESLSRGPPGPTSEVRAAAAGRQPDRDCATQARAAPAHRDVWSEIEESESGVWARPAARVSLSVRLDSECLSHLILQVQVAAFDSALASRRRRRGVGLPLFLRHWALSTSLGRGAIRRHAATHARGPRGRLTHRDPRRGTASSPWGGGPAPRRSVTMRASTLSSPAGPGGPAPWRST